MASNPKTTKGSRPPARAFYAMCFLGFLMGKLDVPTAAGAFAPLPRTATCKADSHVCMAARDDTPRLVKPKGNKKRSTLKRRRRPKPNSRRQRGDKTTHHHRRPTGPRPVLTEYEENRNLFVNRQRLHDAIGCQHFGLCSGCVVDDKVGSVETITSAKLYFSSTAVRRKRLDVIEQGVAWSTEKEDDGFYKVVVPSDVRGWRTQAKLAVAPKSSAWAKDGCHFGLYERGTHQVLSIPNCAVHHPSINRAVGALVAATEKVGIPAFQETSREGGLRYVQLQVERITGKICLTLVWNAETLKETQPALSRLMKELNRLEPDLWHSVWCHCNDGIGNNIFSRNLRRWHRISGPEFLREPLPTGNHGWLYFSPLTFRQGNLQGFDVLANDVARAVPGGSKVCELYAGVGVLGLSSLVYHAEAAGGEPLEWIRCSDENSANARCFQRAVESLPLETTGRQLRRTSKVDNEDDGQTLAELAALMESGQPSPQKERRQEKTSYTVASADKALRGGQALGAQVLIVDPPRKGLEDGVLEELCKPFNPDQPYVESANVLTMPDEKVSWTNDIQTLIYVSCGFDALARDCERMLSSQAAWVLESATGYVLFPGSDHVETLCVFKRK